MAFCTGCGAGLPPGAAFCGACGRATGPGGHGPAVTMAPPATQVHVHVAPSYPARRPITQGVAILGLVLNILVWPGLGSLVGGEQVGWAQGFLTLLGLVLIFTLVGIIVGVPLMIAMWIWGIVTGVQMIQRANAQPSW